MFYFPQYLIEDLVQLEKSPQNVFEHAAAGPCLGALDCHLTWVAHVLGRRFHRNLILFDTGTARQALGNPFGKPSFLEEWKKGRLNKTPGTGYEIPR